MPPGTEFWDERYGKEEFAYGTAPNDFLKEQMETLSLPPKAKVLMLAEGEGRNAVALAEKGHEVTGVDISAVGLKKAEKLAAQRNVQLETVEADLGQYDFGKEKWDFIVGIFCHMPPPVRARVLAEIPGALKPGGLVLFECYSPQQLEFKTGGPPSVEMMYSAELLSASPVGKELQVLRNEELVRDVVEGEFHTGKGAVVQFVAKK